MPLPGFKNITLKENFVNESELTTSKMTYLLDAYWEEQEKLKKFALKITKIPETVRVYSNPLMKKGI